MPAPETIDQGLTDGVYKQALDVPIRGGTDEGGRWMQKHYFIPWEYLEDFEKGLLGVSRNPGNAIGSWSMNAPYSDPAFPRMFAFSTTWEPRGTVTIPSNPAEYSDSLIGVTYRTPGFTIGGVFEDPYFLHSFTADPTENAGLLWATQEMDYSMEYINIPGRRLLINDSALAATVPYPKSEYRHPISITDLIISWQRVPYMPRGAADYVNKVNDDTFLGRPTGCVRLAGVKTAIRAWTDGTRTRTVTAHFRIRDHSWNRDLHVNDNGNLEWGLVEDEDGNLPFEAVDMRPLLFVAT